MAYVETINVRFPKFIAEWFPLFLINFLRLLGPFPHIFDPFPLFSKTLKISIC